MPKMYQHNSEYISISPVKQLRKSQDLSSTDSSLSPLKSYDANQNHGEQAIPTKTKKHKKRRKRRIIRQLNEVYFKPENEGVHPVTTLRPNRLLFKKNFEANKKSKDTKNPESMAQTSHRAKMIGHTCHAKCKCHNFFETLVRKSPALYSMGSALTNYSHDATWKSLAMKRAISNSYHNLTNRHLKMLDEPVLPKRGTSLKERVSGEVEIISPKPRHSHNLVQK
jgi:hypothetical protein